MQNYQEVWKRFKDTKFFYNGPTALEAVVLTMDEAKEILDLIAHYEHLLRKK